MKLFLICFLFMYFTLVCSLCVHSHAQASRSPWPIFVQPYCGQMLLEPTSLSVTSSRGDWLRFLLVDCHYSWSQAWQESRFCPVLRSDLAVGWFNLGGSCR